MNKQTAKTEKSAQWYVLRGEMRYGPYDYSAIINMLQKGELQDYNYIWASHLPAWTLIGEAEDFSREALSKLVATKAKDNGFIRREYARIEVDIEVNGHDEHHFFDGKCLSLSESGALVLLNTPLLTPGEDLVLHFKINQAKQEPFNVVAQVVRKNFTKQRLNVKSGLHYAVRFTHVSPRGHRQLKMLIKEN